MASQQAQYFPRKLTYHLQTHRILRMSGSSSTKSRFVPCAQMTGAVADSTQSNRISHHHLQTISDRTITLHQAKPNNKRPSHLLHSSRLRLLSPPYHEKSTMPPTPPSPLPLNSHHRLPSPHPYQQATQATPLCLHHHPPAKNHPYHTTPAHPINQIRTHPTSSLSLSLSKSKNHKQYPHHNDQLITQA